MSRFTFPTLSELQDKYFTLVNKLLEKHLVDNVEQLPANRQTQLSKIEKALHQAESLNVQNFGNNQKQFEQHQSATVLGAYLEIKQEIRQEYSNSYTATLFSFAPSSVSNKFINPESSALYSEIDNAMGVTAENELDKQTLQHIQMVHLANQAETAVSSLNIARLAKEGIENAEINLKKTDTKIGTWDKNPKDQILDGIRLFDNKNLKNTETRESGLVFEGNLPHMPRF